MYVVCSLEGTFEVRGASVVVGMSLCQLWEKSSSKILVKRGMYLI